MLQRIGEVILALSLLLPGSVFAEEARLVTISIENRTPSFEAVPSIEVFGAPAELFTKMPDSKFEYKFKIAEDKWFNIIDIRIVWKDAYLKNDSSKVDWEQTIRLRIRRDFPDKFSFPIYFSNNRSSAELSRLDQQGISTQQFEVFFRSWQIASYYRETAGPQHQFTKTAVRLFFHSAARLAEQPDYFVVMSDDAERMALEAFGTGSGTGIAERANSARSVYWLDLKQIDKYVAKGDCTTARLLMAAFQALKAEDAAAFNAAYGGAPTVLDEKAKIIAAKCGTS